MFKKYLFIIFLLLLTNCSAPGTALLGPIFTGASTGSAAQASLSFGTNQVVKKIHESSKKAKQKVNENSKKAKKKFQKMAKKIENFQLTSENKSFLHFYK